MLHNRQLQRDVFIVPGNRHSIPNRYRSLENPNPITTSSEKTADERNISAIFRRSLIAQRTESVPNLKSIAR